MAGRGAGRSCGGQSSPSDPTPTPPARAPIAPCNGCTCGEGCGPQDAGSCPRPLCAAPSTGLIVVGVAVETGRKRGGFRLAMQLSTAVPPAQPAVATALQGRSTRTADCPWNRQHLGGTRLAAGRTQGQQEATSTATWLWWCSQVPSNRARSSAKPSG